MKLLRWDTKEVIFELECSSWEQLLKGALKEKISFYIATLVIAILMVVTLVVATGKTQSTNTK